MGLLDDVRALLPENRLEELHELRPSEPALWMIDPNPEEKPPHRLMFAFLVWERSGNTHLLANRSGAPRGIEEGALVKEISTPYTKLGSRKVPIRICRLLHRDEARFRDPDQEDDVHRPPGDVTGVVYPEREFSAETTEELQATV